MIIQIRNIFVSVTGLFVSEDENALAEAKKAEKNSPTVERAFRQPRANFSGGGGLPGMGSPCIDGWAR